MFVEIPPHVSVRDFVRRAEGRSSRKIQHIRKRYWGQRFWGRGYFSTRSGNIIDDIVNRYLDRHTHKNGFSPPRLDPTGVSRSVSNRSEEHTSELQSLMRISYAVFCLQKK